MTAEGKTDGYKGAKPVNLLQIYNRTLSTNQKLEMVVAIICTVLAGMCQPAVTIVFWGRLDDFQDPDDPDADSAYDKMLIAVPIIVGIVMFMWLLNVVWLTGFIVNAERALISVRRQYFEALLAQSVPWFDAHPSEQLNSETSALMQTLRGGIGEKAGIFINACFTFVSGWTAAFYFGPQIALALLSISPALVYVSISMKGVFVKLFKKAAEANAEAGGVAEESLNSVKTIAAFGQEKARIDLYSEKIEKSRKIATRNAAFIGLITGSMMMCIFLMYALGFFMGSLAIEHEWENWFTGEQITPGDIAISFFCVLMGTFSVGQALPHYKMVIQAQTTAGKVFALIDESRRLKTHSDKNPILNSTDPEIFNMKGHIVLKDVSFHYPTRKEVQILDKISFEIKPNQTTALVGETGCGKSTVFQLLERFYDPVEGKILIDGAGIERFDPHILRSRIALVSQEPILFANSIKENIKFGNQRATDDEIRAVCEKANALNFIEEQDSKFDTFVGQSGSQLSGGQKQRIAIARALIKNPAILLLDEATSSLDRRSEHAVQMAISNISGTVTTVIIAHRLTTIQNANKIVVFKNGKIEEQGTHTELIAADKVYANLVKFQQTESTEGSSSDDDAKKQDGKSDSDRDNNINEVSDKEHTNNSAVATTGVVVTGVAVKNTQSEEISPDEISLKPKVEEQPQMSLIKRILSQVKNNRKWLIFGLASSVLHACLFPAFAITLGVYIETLVDGYDSDFRRDANTCSLIFLGLSFIIGGVMLSQTYSLSRSGEGLTYTLRRLSFVNMLKMQPSWYDEKENAYGTLSTRLSTEATLVHNLVGPTVGAFMQAVFAIGLGTILGFIFAWQLAIAGILLSPLFVFCGLSSSQSQEGYEKDNKQAVNVSGSVLSESLSNIRTLKSLGIQEKVVGDYLTKLQGTLKGITKHGVRSGLTLGFGHVAPIFFYTFCLLVGAYLIKEGEITFQDLTMTMFAIAFGAYATGLFLASMPDMTSAKTAAKNIFKLEDMESSIDPFDPSGLVLKQEETKGYVSFQDVTFNYPNRPRQILDGLTFSLEPGTKLALVGRSGCGKSTTIQLLLRFYDMNSGTIAIDGKNIRDINVKSLRSIISLVSQEPILFNTTIENNIKFGKASATSEEIRDAAQKANALPFIEGKEGDPKDSSEGFQRVVGPKGEKLSGGQKQRVAIARAIIRNPKILLLDEATSALDAASEELVQNALNTCMEGKSTIIIAHRLNTIESADKICVMNEGKVVEQGGHKELMTKKEHYFNLVNALG